MPFVASSFERSRSVWPAPSLARKTRPDYTSLPTRSRWNAVRAIGDSSGGSSPSYYDQKVWGLGRRNDLASNLSRAHSKVERSAPQCLGCDGLNGSARVFFRTVEQLVDRSSRCYQRQRRSAISRLGCINEPGIADGG